MFVHSHIFKFKHKISYPVYTFFVTALTKPLQIWWLTTTEINFLIILEIRIPKRTLRG